MKVYHSNTAFGLQRLNKVKAVATLTGSTVTFEANEKAPVLQTLFRATLPVLETAQGAVHSSNTIIRYLANSTQKLYGKNIHQASLIDQWLDGISFDLEPAVAALTSAVEGSQVAVFKAWTDATKFLQTINQHLEKNTYLVGGALSIADVSLYVNVSVLFQYALAAAQRSEYPNVGKWFEVIAKEIGNALPTVTLAEKTHESLACSRKEAKCDGKKGGQNKKAAGKPDTKPAAKPAADDFDPFADEKPAKPAAKPADDDFDPFADDDTPAAPKVEAPKPEKKEKKKAIAKSIIIFDVKVYEEETNLDQLAKKVLAIAMDGLVWNKDYKILPVAYTVKKLQIGAVVEDDKVSTDDLFEIIESWEDVQSTDVVSFQKV